MSTFALICMRRESPWAQIAPTIAERRTTVGVFGFFWAMSPFGGEFVSFQGISHAWVRCENCVTSWDED